MPDPACLRFCRADPEIAVFERKQVDAPDDDVSSQEFRADVFTMHHGRNSFDMFRLDQGDTASATATFIVITIQTFSENFHAVHRCQWSSLHRPDTDPFDLALLR